MFNPYHARPIGSEQFENHLLTVMTEKFYTQQQAREAIPEYPVIPRAMPGESSWKMDPIDRCWNDLNTAILSLALIDYLDAYASKLWLADRHSPKEWVQFSRCVVIENEYLRTDEDRAALLDAILNEIHACCYLQEKLDVIQRIKSRISSQAGWSGRGRKECETNLHWLRNALRWNTGAKA